jgi:hypothetical protein
MRPLLISALAATLMGCTCFPPQSSQLDDKSDPVIKKAKATIAAKMENPASVEFVEMKRADRKDALGNSVDTICGYVSGKTASGGVTGDTPFLYLVQEDEAYIGGFMATTAYRYRNICKWEAGHRWRTRHHGH